MVIPSPILRLPEFFDHSFLTLHEGSLAIPSPRRVAIRAEIQGSKRLMRYSCNIMTDRLSLDPIDPIELTRQLCEIQSTTYHEGAVGDFLAGFLPDEDGKSRKPPWNSRRECRRRPALECLRRHRRPVPRLGLLHPHGHRSALHPLQPGCRVHVWPRSLRRQRHHRRSGGRRRGSSRAGISRCIVVCFRRRARLRRSEGRQPFAQGQPLSHQWRAHR